MKKSIFLGHLIILILTLPPPTFSKGSSTNRPGIKVKALPPVYTVEIKDVTLYEATIPIFFHVQLPKIPDEFPPHKDHIFQHHRDCSLTGQEKHNGESNSTREYNHYHCALERQFILAANHIVKDLHEMQKTQIVSKYKSSRPITVSQYFKGTTNSSRKKRQAAPVLMASSLLAGFLLRPAVSKFTGNLFGSNEEWAEHFNSIRESLIKDHELLLDFERSTEAYTQEMSDILSTMSALLSEQKRDLIWSLRLLSTKMHADLIQDAIHSCKTKHLPGNLIKPEFLRKSLASLNKNLTSSLNYTLAINSDDENLGKYYKLPIVDCLFTEDKAHITVNVPLRRKHVQWKLYEIIHTKYAFHNQICELYPQEAAYLAEEIGTGSRSVLITNLMLKYCSVYEDQLCMIPQFGKDSVQSLKCTSLAVKSAKGNASISKQAEALLKSCSFRCYSSDEVIVTQVGDAPKLVITNAKNITYQCGGSKNVEKTLQIGRYGAVEVDLECDCYIKIDGEESLSQSLPCAYSFPPNGSQQGSGHDMFSFTVPFVWVHNLSRILEEEENNVFIESHEELHTHINQQWAQRIPVLNFSKVLEEKLLNFTIPEKAVSHYSSGLTTTVEVWLGILTVIVLLHAGLTFYCCFRLFMARLGEYELPPHLERQCRVEGWITKRRRSSELSDSNNHHKSHNNRNSHSSNNSSRSNRSERGNRQQNFEVYQENIEQRDKLNESLNDNNGTTSKESHEVSYKSNRNSILNKLI